jgi:hypothetical protein
MATSSTHHFPQYRSIAIAAFAFALAGCKSSSTTPAAPATTSGALLGRVLLYSGAGSAIAVDTGVTVSVSGSSVTASTNDSGGWILPGIEAGSCTLTFTKSGFGTVMQFGDIVSLNDTIQDSEIVMSEAPADLIGFEAFQFIAPNALVFNCKMPTPASNERTVVCCLSTDSAMLAANPFEAPWIFASVQAGGYDAEFGIDTTISEASIANDTMLYACVCIAGEGTNYQSFSHYYDPVTMQEVYSALGPRSQILSAKLR